MLLGYLLHNINWSTFGILSIFPKNEKQKSNENLGNVMKITLNLYLGLKH